MDSCSLSEAESIFVCSILDDLEKRMSLAKLEAIKSPGAKFVEPISGRESLSSTCDAGEGYHNGAFLEACLEYEKLDKELSHLRLNSSSGKEQSGDKDDHDKTIDQFTKDVDHILSVIQVTRKSLRESNNFSILHAEIEKAKLILDKKTKLKSDIEEIKGQISSMKRELRQTHERMSFEEQFKVGETNRLKDEQHLILTEGEETLKCTDIYFSAKSSNTDWTHREEMASKAEKIALAQEQIDRDIHCLSMMDSWTEEFCENLDAQIKEWKSKLRRDDLVMEMRIETKQRTIKGQLQQIKSLNETVSENLLYQLDFLIFANEVFIDIPAEIV